MIVSPALVLMWITRLEPATTYQSPFGVRAFSALAKEAVAAAVAKAANEDDDPLEAAAELVAIGYFESGFVPDAISRAEDPTWAYGPWQLSDLWLPPLPVPLGWQASRALYLVRDSEEHCGDLTRYVSGHCRGAPGVAAARSRLAQKILRADLPGAYLEPSLPPVVRVHVAERS